MMRPHIVFSLMGMLIGSYSVHAQPVAPAASAARNGKTVNINRANALAISAALDGIGPSKAAAIVMYRKRFGDFKTVDDLGRVDGISPVTLSRIKPYVRLADAAPVAPTHTVSIAALTSH